MYEVFYNLKAEPFRLSPDHKFCYEHKGYAKARAYMAYAFKRAEGFVMITGRPGTGKTTLIGELVESLANDNVRTANLVCTQLQADDLLKTVAFSFGVGQGDFDKAQLLQRLTTLFHRWHQEGGRALLIVDEAQDLSVSAMEELRLLTNIQVGGQPLVQIFLLGQPELRDLVMSPEMEQVHQRVIAASHLRGLEVEETEAYVAHRLHAVGWKGDPAIDRAVFPLIHKFSEGVPRRINLICSRLFLLCSVEQRHEVLVADVRDVVGELQAENLAAGSWFSEADFDLTREPEWLAVPGQAEAEVEVEEEASAAVTESDPEAPDTAATEPTDAEVDEQPGLVQPGVVQDGVAQDNTLIKQPVADEVPDTREELESPAGSDSEYSAPSQPSTSQPSTAEPSPADLPEEPEAPVEVIEELFEVVTAQEYVDLPEHVAHDLEEGEATSEGGRYFAGDVIAESAMGSGAAVSELASLPENFIADAGGNTPSHADAEEEPPVKKLDELQRDGKAWPTSSRVSSTTSAPSPRTNRAIAILAIVATVGAGVFFLELYLSSQDGEGGAGSLLNRLSRSEAPAAAEEASPAVPSAPAPLKESLPEEFEEPLPVLEAEAMESPDRSGGMPEMAGEPVALAGEETGVTLDAEGSNAAELVAALREADVEELVPAPAVIAETTGNKNTPPAVDPAQPVVKQVYVVSFDFDSTALGQDASVVLSRALEKLQEYPASTATIARNARGQTPGTAAATMSEARAGAVQRFLLDEGVAPTRISIEKVSDQVLTASISGSESSRTIQVIVSRSLES